jgi:hypothetical protein
MAFLLPGWMLHIIVGNPGTYLLVHYSLGSQVALNAILVCKQRHASSYENSAWSIVFLKLKVELPFVQDQRIYRDMLGRIEPMFRTSG